MRRFRWVLLPVALAALAPAPAPAQKKSVLLPVPAPAPLLRKLQLTAEQEAKLDVARQAWEEELARVKAQGAGADLKQALGGAAAGYRSVLAAVLSPAQRVQLLDLVEEARQYGALGEVGIALAAMDLTVEQKGRIQEAVARAQPELERLGAAAKLNRDEAAARQAEELRRKLLDEVTAYLSPRQRRSLPASKKTE